MPAGGQQRPSVGLGGAQRPSLPAAHPPNRPLEALPRMSYAATRGGCSGGAVGGGAGDCRSGSSSAAAVRPALRTGREAPGPSVGSSGYRREEAATARSSGYGEARSSGYGRGPAAPPRDLRPPRGEAGSGPPRHYEHPATAAAARAQQLERGGSSTALGGPSTPALASGGRAAERGGSLGANALPPARRGEERRGEEPPLPGRGEPAKCDAAPPRRRLQPHHVLGAATPRVTSCVPTWWRLQPCHVCWRPLPSHASKAAVPPCCPPMCLGATSATGRTRRLHAPGSARREIDTLTRRPRETSGTSVAVVPSRSCARHAWCAARTHLTHLMHGTHKARTSARTSARTNARTHASPPGRPADRSVSLRRRSTSHHSVRHSARLLPVCRCGSRATAPASSTRSPTDCATARRRMHCDGRWPRSYSPFDHNPDPPHPDPDSAPELNPNPSPAPTPTPESGGRWPVSSSPTRPSPSPTRRSKTGCAATIGSRGCNQAW